MSHSWQRYRQIKPPDPDLLVACVEAEDSQTKRQPRERAMSPDASWKRHERVCAARLGGKRAGPLGKESADVIHSHLSIECKQRKVLPDWLLGAMSQARGNAKAGQLPVVILHLLNARHDKDIVLLSLKDFEDLYGSIREEGPAS